MKTAQWTLPKGHRANLVADIFAFPLFFSAKDKIDVLNSPHLDPLFALLSLLPTDLTSAPVNETEDERLARSYWYMGRTSVQGIIANCIIEAFGWVDFEGRSVPPSEMLRRHPIPTPKDAEDARRIAVNLMRFRPIEEMSPWRAILFDYGIFFDCSEYRRKLLGWECLPNYPRAGVMSWSKYPADDGKSCGYDMFGKPEQRVRVICG